MQLVQLVPANIPECRIDQPLEVTLPSVYQVKVEPAVTETLVGYDEPAYLVVPSDPNTTGSQQLSVENATIFSTPDRSTVTVQA